MESEVLQCLLVIVWTSSKWNQGFLRTNKVKRFKLMAYIKR